MKFIDFIKDKVFDLLVNFMGLLLILLMLIGLNVHILLIIIIPLVYEVTFIVILLHEYFKKNKFYKDLNTSINNLDSKYYITEVINKSDFLEGNLLIDYLYEINKSYIENINKYKIINEEFKDYIELWCHEVKTPIATSKLVIDNNKSKTNDSILEEIEKIEYFVEQVLYFSKSENVNEDYIINKVNLKNIVNEVIKNNKKDLLSKKIKVNIENINVEVESDPKWLTYIINQIITNSIKYSKEKNSEIKIYSSNFKNNVVLYISDNGIGIKEEDIEKVFDKGFTGSNGRKIYSSTGMGLYLVKKLCDKLGINISLKSKENKETIVSIVFPNNSLIKEIK